MNLLLTLLITWTLLAYQPQQKTNSPATPKKDCRKDTDGDGINDCFDQCDHTPKGIRVDSKGCPRDTDGDGIPDYLDAELITPTECQPSDSSGRGDCNRAKKSE
mgnify:CR=1 FL=1